MLELNFTPFPTFETERLILREIQMSDSASLFELRSNPQAMYYLDRLMAKSVEDAEALIRKFDNLSKTNTAIVWGISLKTDPKLIGTLGYHRIDKENHRAEIGYMLHPDHWHKGLMKEGVTKVLDYGFRTLGFHSLDGHVNPANQPSIEVLKRQGFVKEGYFRENIHFDGKFLDTEVYGLIAQGEKELGIGN